MSKTDALKGTDSWFFKENFKQLVFIASIVFLYLKYQIESNQEVVLKHDNCMAYACLMLPTLVEI